MKAIAGAVLVAALGASPYPKMGAVDQYMMPDPAAEMAMARTAAPPSVSAHATVLVLTKTGYVVGSKGTNGWVCFVDRAWTSGFDDPEFWNWHNRSPQCQNPPAVKSVLPQFEARAKWALSGDTREQIAQKAQAAYANHQFTDPAPGAFAFMLSKESYINDEVKGPWRPHVMLFIASSQIDTWAAGFAGSPILGPAIGTFRAYEPITIAIPVRRWSDGSLAPQ
jgi:hypothetical protein